MRGKRRNIWVFIIGAVVMLGAMFVPGPNGLLSIGLKIYHLHRRRVQIARLRARCDSLQKNIKIWQDPAFATEQARKIFADTAVFQPDSQSTR